MIVKCQIGTDGQKRLQMISNTSCYDMYSAAYKNLYKVSKLALTLPVTKEHFAKEHFQNVSCSKHDYEARYRQII